MYNFLREKPIFTITSIACLSGHLEVPNLKEQAVSVVHSSCSNQVDNQTVWRFSGLK